MKKLMPFILLIIFSTRLPAQYNTNENKVWAFGILTGLNFNSGAPVNFTTGMQNSEGVASVCDGGGNLLFYTHGMNVNDKTGAIMPSSFGMVPFAASSTTQGALIVPKPGSSTIYYIFSIEWTAGNPAAASGQFMYSVVDMSLNGGLGDVITIGTPITTNLSEKMIAVKGNACNIWVLTHSRDSALFRAYEVTAAGINLTPVVSAVGTFAGLKSYAGGVIKVSHDRARIVAQCMRSAIGGAVGTELYDFDANTGIVSNCRLLDNSTDSYGAEFSPDNTKLYTSGHTLGNNVVAQYNVSLPTTAAIIASKYIVYTYPLVQTGLVGDMKLAADNKIYRPSDFTPPTINRFVDVINAPNNAGASCNFVAQAVNVSPNWVVYGLPNTVWSVHPDTFYARHDTTACFTGSSATIRSSLPGTHYVWSNGDTLAAHTVTTPGTYWVAVFNSCQVTFDTIVVYKVAGPVPPVVSGKITYCFGEPYLPPTATGSGILWYTSATSTAGSATPPFINTFVPGTYTLYATQTIGCEGDKDSITITVLPPIDVAFTFAVRANCEHITVDFTNTYTSADTYKWNFGNDEIQDTSRHSVSHNYSRGIYYVKLTARTRGCERDTTMTVDVTNVSFTSGRQLMNVTPDATIRYGNSIQLNAENAVLYMWRPNDGSLNNSNINNPVASPATTTRYTVYGYDEDGCIDSAFVTISVDSSMHECIPTAFTPDGDGLNDIFLPECAEYQKLVGFSVYNRWGERVFFSTNIQKGWDGTYNGIQQELGVYFYMIVVSRPGNEQNIVYKGDITLIR